jgi:hypothetical protein
MECDTCGENHSTWDHRVDPLPAPDQAGLLPQHRRCGRCKQVTLAWDSRPCGQHAAPGQAPPVGEAPPVTPASSSRRRDLAALAREQAAEARTARGDDLDAFFRRAAASTPAPTAAPARPDGRRSS